MEKGRALGSPHQWLAVSHALAQSILCLLPPLNSNYGWAWLFLSCTGIFCAIHWSCWVYYRIAYVFLNLTKSEMHLEFYVKIIFCAPSVCCSIMLEHSTGKLTIMTSQVLKGIMFWLSNRLYMMQIYDLRSDFTNILVIVIWLISSNVVS